MKLTKDFDLDEFTYSDTARKLRLNNNPSHVEIGALLNLCEKLLQPLRDALGKPITINSGYRNECINTLVGGSKTSQHMKGEAADCAIDGKAIDLLQLLLDLELNFDQAILYKSKNFLHLSLKSSGANRKQVIEYE